MRRTKAATAYRDNLIQQYCGYTQKLVDRLIRQFNLPVRLRDDLISAGLLGLVEAADRYNPSKGQDFRRYAYFRIRGSVIDSLRRNPDVSGANYKKLKALRAAHEISNNAVVENCNDKEALSLILEFAAQSALVFKLSMSDSVAAAAVAKKQSNPEDRLSELTTNQLLRRLIKKLPAEERHILTEYYLKERNFIEIVKRRKGFSASWVSRLHARGIERLRKLYTEAQVQESMRMEGR